MLVFYHKMSMFHKYKKWCFELLIYLQLVFVQIGETMSGGNFHGEYPAKVTSQ